MKAAGIIQSGEAILYQAAAPFDLPGEADQAREVIDALFAALQRVREHHVFGKGMGLAAPQIGLGGGAALIIPPDADPDAEPIVLLNPRNVNATTETDEQYEGCLSFFDVRGIVARPWSWRSNTPPWTASRRSPASTTGWPGWSPTNSTTCYPALL
ncbi:peptide deformylase [Nonomuraea polychroma]|uniref:peptide deformylase n=1 Tax=Nonomuraea polychroma TaxID=46176 RepID=UPI003D945F97